MGKTIKADIKGIVSIRKCCDNQVVPDRRSVKCAEAEIAMRQRQRVEAFWLLEFECVPEEMIAEVVEKRMKEPGVISRMIELKHQEHFFPTLQE
jgi:hypothetical protein